MCLGQEKKKKICLCTQVCAHVQESEKEKTFGLERKVDFFFSWPQWAFFACITDVTRDTTLGLNLKKWLTQERFFIMPWALDLTWGPLGSKGQQQDI